MISYNSHLTFEFVTVIMAGFQVQCQAVATGSQRSIPVVVRLVDRNDNAPEFVGGPYSATIPEVRYSYWNLIR